MSQTIETIKVHYRPLAEIKDREIAVYFLAGVLKTYQESFKAKSKGIQACLAINNTSQEN